MWRQMKK